MTCIALPLKWKARIGDATHVSTIESLELFNALVVLKDGINAQVGKVVKGSTPTRYATVPRCIPALTLAHQHNLNATVVVALNPLNIHCSYVMSLLLR